MDISDVLKRSPQSPGIVMNHPPFGYAHGNAIHYPPFGYAHGNAIHYPSSTNTPYAVVIAGQATFVPPKPQ